MNTEATDEREDDGSRHDSRRNGIATSLTLLELHRPVDYKEDGTENRIPSRLVLISL
jgi:hypothetical protein